MAASSARFGALSAASLPPAACSSVACAAAHTLRASGSDTCAGEREVRGPSRRPPRGREAGGKAWSWAEAAATRSQAKETNPHGTCLGSQLLQAGQQLGQERRGGGGVLNLGRVGKKR